MAFELDDFTDAKMTSINARSEKHGPDELHPAIDLSFQVEAANDILSFLDGGLLSALYHKTAASDSEGQHPLDGVDQASHLPNLRFPMLGPLKWQKEYAGYDLTIQHGLGGKSDIQLTDCKVNGFSIDAKEGGTVLLKFRVQCSTGLNEKTLGKLALLVQHEVPIMLTAPEAKNGQGSIENPLPHSLDKADKGKPESPFKEPQTPEDAFTKAVTG